MSTLMILFPASGVCFSLILTGIQIIYYGLKLSLFLSIISMAITSLMFNTLDFSTINFQFVKETLHIEYLGLFLGVDSLSVYFIILASLITPIALLSASKSVRGKRRYYISLILSLEILLVVVFLVLDTLLFYVFFESILPPLFILIGIFGSDNRVKASFYLFLYTLLGSLFLLLAILVMSSIMSATDFETLFKGNFAYALQVAIFCGIFIAFAVKTPTIFLNTWLLKAHVESPLGGSIILAAVVLKLSLYGILRLILPLLPKAYIEYTFIIYAIGIITIIYASLSTLRTIDVKELIAYSSVSHAAVYLLGVFSNNIQGIEGAINLGLAHGLVSPGLFICAGGILYDRSHTRLISNYKGMAQIMPLFAVLFFILCLGNCGAPLTLNFVGEFMSLYGIFERSSFFGVFASSSMIFAAAYTIYMYQRISFGGSYSSMFTVNFADLNKREFVLLISLVVPTVFLGIYAVPVLDAMHYSVSTLIYSSDIHMISCDAPDVWGLYLQDSVISHMVLDLGAGSIISVAATVLFLQIVYLQLVKGKAVFGYPWAVPQLFSDYYRILKDICSPGLGSSLHNLPKPHAFTNLPLQSGRDYRNLADQVDKFADEVNKVPSAEEMEEKAKGNPETVRKNADELIDEIKAKGEELSSRIERAQERTTDQDEKAGFEALKDQTVYYTKSATDDVKEGANTAIDVIDGTPATAHLMYEEYVLPVFFVFGDSSIIIATFSILLRSLLIHDIRFSLLIFYNLYKNNINRIFITILLLIFIITMYCLL